MVSRGHWIEKKIDKFHEECKQIGREENRKAEILHAKYDKIDIEECVNSQSHLTNDRKEQLKSQKAKIAAFQGTRGKWKGKPIELKVKEGLVPFYT